MHTRHLTLMEDLAYRRLIDLYYTTEQPITLDVEKAAKLIGMREYIKEVSEVLSDFFLKSEDGYKNNRCDKEIEAYKAKADRARSANTSRWNAKKSDVDLKSDMKSDAFRVPTNNQEPRTTNQEPVEGKKPATAARLPTAKRKHPLPESFEPKPKHYELAASLSVNLMDELPNFCDHHVANGSVMASWDAALSKWIRNAAKWGGKAGATKFLTAQQQRDENNRRSTAEFLADKSPFFGTEPESIEGEFTNA